MPEAHVSNPPSGSTSYIPVMASPAPRLHQSRSTLPSSLSLPQLSLLPTSRHMGRYPSGSPLQASPSSISSASSGGIGESPVYIHSPTAIPASGIPKFRSLRNMLSFGPKPSAPSNAATPASQPRRSTSSSPSPNTRPVAKNNFLSFGSRSSTTIERQIAPSSYHPPTGDQPPVISIEPSGSGEDIRETDNQTSKWASEGSSSTTAPAELEPAPDQGMRYHFI